MTTIAIYASAFGPRADLSIAAQLDSCRRLATSLGCSTPAEYVIRDNKAVPGWPDTIALWAACVTGGISTLIVTSRHRLEPDPAKLETALEILADEEVTIRFVDEEVGLVCDMI